MNLKESFRYQKFLDQMLRSACVSIMDRDHSVTATKVHRRSEVNPDAEDIVEEVKRKEAFFSNDDVVRFAVCVIREKQKLSAAIGKAKASVGFDAVYYEQRNWWYDPRGNPGMGRDLQCVSTEYMPHKGTRSY